MQFYFVHWCLLELPLIQGDQPQMWESASSLDVIKYTRATLTYYSCWLVTNSLSSRLAKEMGWKRTLINYHDRIVMNISGSIVIIMSLCSNSLATTKEMDGIACLWCLPGYLVLIHVIIASWKRKRARSNLEENATTFDALAYHISGTGFVTAKTYNMRLGNLMGMLMSLFIYSFTILLLLLSSPGMNMEMDGNYHYLAPWSTATDIP